MILNCGVAEDSWESLGLQDIKPVNPNGNQPWILTGMTDAEAEAPTLWPPDAIGKDPDAGKDWIQEKKRMTGDEMVAWHHWLDGHEFEQALGVGDGQGSLACYSPWSHKKSGLSNWTELLNKNNFVILITGAVVLCSMNKDFDQFIYEDNSFNINIWADLHVLRKLKWLVSVFGML